MTEIRNTPPPPPDPMRIGNDPERDGRQGGEPGLGGGRGTHTGLNSGMGRDARGRGLAASVEAARLQGFEASLARASAPADGLPPATDTARRQPDDDRPRDAQELVVIPRAEPGAPPPARAAEPANPAMAQKIEALVDRIMAEIEAGQRATIRHGAGGALTVSFPLTDMALMISRIALTVQGATLTVTLSTIGDGPDEAALRDLAQSLATRHPTKTVRICREESGRNDQSA